MNNTPSVIGFRVSKKIYNELTRLASSHKMSVGNYSKKIVIDHLSPTSEMSTNKSLIGIHNEQSEIKSQIDFLTELFLHYVTIHFASHYEFEGDENEKKALALKALSRQKMFYETFVNNIYKTNESHFQKLKADIFEAVIGKEDIDV